MRGAHCRKARLELSPTTAPHITDAAVLALPVFSEHTDAQGRGAGSPTTAGGYTRVPGTLRPQGSARGGTNIRPSLKPALASGFQLWAGAEDMQPCPGESQGTCYSTPAGRAALQSWLLHLWVQQDKTGMQTLGTQNTSVSSVLSPPLEQAATTRAASSGPGKRFLLPQAGLSTLLDSDSVVATSPARTVQQA